MHCANPAFVLGMFETGLAVGRSLGRNGVKVIGIDYKKDIGFFSRYIQGRVCPHPVEEEGSFIEFLIAQSRAQRSRPVLFLTSDDFLPAVSGNRAVLEGYFLMNLPRHEIMTSVMDKSRQTELAMKSGISCPLTFSLGSVGDLDRVRSALKYPVLIKARNVYSWRKHIGGSTKAFIAHDDDDIIAACTPLITRGINVMVQQIIDGPDTNHYKVCCYISRKGEFLLVFTLQKLRQSPVRFGVGSVVRSVHYPKLTEVGKKFFEGIGFRGVGSVEFKLDEMDHDLKFIELNPRYWQQNALAERCGMNFALMDYREATGQAPGPQYGFPRDVGWANMYMDFSSFMEYHRRKQVTVRDWLQSMRSVRVLSDFAVDDVVPGFYETRFGMKLVGLPRFILKKVRHG